MSDSPIFDQIVNEFAAEGVVYEEFVRFTTPTFEWEPKPVVQLDKQTTGVKLAEVSLNPRPELLQDAKEADSHTADFGRLVQDYVSQVGQSFAEQHPLAIVTDASFETNPDGNSTTLVIEAVKPITPVKSLSERNSAQLME